MRTRARPPGSCGCENESKFSVSGIVLNARGMIKEGGS
jgi:hypothetical protein